LGRIKDAKSIKIGSIEAKLFCMNKDHKNLQNDRFEQRALQILKKEGLRITEGRKAILKYLANSRHAMSVKDIHENLSREGVKVDLVSVYRTVSVLCARHLVHHIAAVDGYSACGIGDHEHSVGHTVCTSCGKVDELEIDQSVYKETLEAARLKGIKTIEIRVEITGTCSDCAITA